MLYKTKVPIFIDNFQKNPSSSFQKRTKKNIHKMVLIQ